MSFLRIKELLEQTAQYCADHNLPCSQHQLHGLVVDYDRLSTVTESHAYALQIFEVLLSEALHHADLCQWLTVELRFETQVAATSNRQQAARNALEQLAEINDVALDLYNERLKRFTHQ